MRNTIQPRKGEESKSRLYGAVAFVMRGTTERDASHDGGGCRLLLEPQLGLAPNARCATQGELAMPLAGSN